jgi:hypothetical protein
MHNEFFKHYIENLPAIEKIASLFREKLPKINIDIESYEEICEKDPIFKELFGDVLNTSYRYTVDVANMEKFAREDKNTSDDDFVESDQKRGVTHDSMISAVNILIRYIEKNNIDIDTKWFNWNKENRAAYGKFAILLTLNVFKEDIILHKIEEIDIEEIKKDLDEVELMVIDYVLILSKIHENHREPDENELEKLKKISTELGKGSEDILSAFYEIYKKRYVKTDIE